MAGGAFEAKSGSSPGVGVETRSEPKAAAEPGLDAELRNSRVVECKRAPPNIQGDPPEVLTGATVVEHYRLDGLVTLVPELSAEDMLGEWDVAAGARLGCVVLVWVSRPGQETGPGSNLVGKMEVVFGAVGRALRWRRPLEANKGFGSEKNGPSTGL